MNKNNVGNVNKFVLFNLDPKLNILFALSAVIYLWYRVSVPYDILFMAGHDDGWFIRRAMNIADGVWFGSYDQMTLIKGPIYPIFLFITSISGFSLQFTIGLLHILSAYVFILALKGVIKNVYIKYIFFITILLVQFPIQRVIRDELSSIVFVIILSLILNLILTNDTGKYLKRPFTIGLLIGIFTLIREDGGFIIYPILTFAFAIILIKHGIKLNFKKIIKIFFTICLVSLVVNNLYKVINYEKYASYVGVELLDDDFMNALSQLYGVRQFPAERYIDVTDENLEAIVKVSPTFQKLKSGFINTPWRAHACSIDKNLCGKIGAGYFMWALRDVMAEQGYYSSPALAKKTYRQIAEEIKNACDKGSIICGNKFLARVPGYELFNFQEFIEILYRSLTTSLQINKITILPSSATTEGDLNTANFLNISNFLLSDSSVKLYEVSGWYYNKNLGNDWFSVDYENEAFDPSENDKLISLTESAKNNQKRQIVPGFERLTSPDIMKNFGDSRASSQRFKFYVPCFNDKCKLIINKKIVLNPLPFSGSKSYDVNGILYLDNIHDVSNKYLNPTANRQQKNAINIFNNLINLYNKIAPILFVIGVLSTLILLISSLKSKMLNKFIIVVIVLWFSIFWRIFFLSIITFYWIPPGINFLYLYPTIFLIPITSMLAIYSIGCKFTNSFIYNEKK